MSLQKYENIKTIMMSYAASIKWGVKLILGWFVTCKHLVFVPKVAAHHKVLSMNQSQGDLSESVH